MSHASQDAAGQFPCACVRCRAADYYHYYHEKAPEELSVLVVHDFRYHYLLTIFHLQEDIKSKFPKPVLDTGLDTGEHGELQNLLAKYTEALRNYEFMLKLHGINKDKASGQLSVLDSDTDEKKRGEEHRLVRGDYNGFLRVLLSTNICCEQKRKMWLCEFSVHEMIRRIIVGLVGAVFVLVPMIILQFKDTNAWRLCTVTLAVVLFSALLGALSHASEADHLAAVAAYAAVMVVFLGTTSSYL